MMEVKNGTPVSIQLRTEVFQENEKTEYFFDLEGQLVQMGDTLYIRYMEQLTNQSFTLTTKTLVDLFKELYPLK